MEEEKEEFLSSSKRTTSFMEQKLATYSNLKQDMIFLKYLFNYNDFSNTYQGGLNSYGLFLLFLAFLEQKKLFHKNTSQKVLRFMQFLSEEFNPFSQALIYNNSPPFIEKNSYFPQFLNTLFISDPTIVYLSNVTPAFSIWNLVQSYAAEAVLKSRQMLEELVTQVDLSLSEDKAL